MRRIIAYISVFCLALACTEKEVKGPAEESAGIISIAADIDGVITTRVDENGFCDKDYVGIYIVDYEGDTPGELRNSGNRADNVMFTYDGATGKWKPAYDIYWKDSHTHIDVYGYYPYGEPADVGNYAFELESDQRKAAENGQLGGYEASDFLWGKASDNAPTASTIRLGFRHKMAGVRVTLNKGLGFTDEEWAAAQKQVVVNNTTRKSVINLATGEVKPVGDPVVAGTIPMKVGDDFRAIVVPQTVPEGKTLISITIDGASYYFKKSGDFTFVQSRQHNFTITVSKRGETGEYEFSLEGESITAWEEDPVSHDPDASEYVIVNVDEPGTLEECLRADGKDPAKVKNLKITGKITSKDFATCRYSMPMLASLNLKEVEIVEGSKGKLEDGNIYIATEADMIPPGAFERSNSLTRIILPDKLKKIGDSAFNHCGLLTGSLIIPEGVTVIDNGAFYSCNFTGELVLPSTLESIGTNAFRGNPFNCELRLPENLKVISDAAFTGCSYLYGKLVLPSHLETLGTRAFESCKALDGDIVIPQTITKIANKTFLQMGVNGKPGSIVLHDGIESIGASTFNSPGFQGQLVLPKNLVSIGKAAFYDSNITGNLVIPESVTVMSAQAFRNCSWLTGTVTIGKNILNIGANTFENCQHLEGLIIEEGVETIGENAFNGCTGLNKIVCGANIPPTVSSGAFDGVPKDKFPLEVPESSIQLYRTADGWSEFSRIIALQDLSVSPSAASALNTAVTRTLTVEAGGEWMVESRPDWVSLDIAEGSGSAEVNVAFAALPSGSGDRSGEIVFLLKDKDYRAVCTVSQYDYKYAEDEFVTLQAASKGKGIDIVFLGDGFTAEDISKGNYVNIVNEAYGYFFGIEPYKTYRDYFNVTMAVSVSAESGIGGVNTQVRNKFNTSVNAGAVIGGQNGESDYRRIRDYISEHLPDRDIDHALVIMITNTGDYSGMTYLWDEGFAISYCPVTGNAYPYDFRGEIQHEAGGHGFGKLGDEAVYHYSFLDACQCSCCGHVDAFNAAKEKGWYDNLSLSGKLGEVPWKHLMQLDKYSGIVDIFEGGYMHSRGVYRSEQNSCMNNCIPYYNAISRESIVRRIMLYAGEEFNFADFVANDSTEDSASVTGAMTRSVPAGQETSSGHEPALMGSMKRR
ncbi:MAG: leucine-rich repeat protein [Candidatus Cryptobacteroides sp.]